MIISVFPHWLKCNKQMHANTLNSFVLAWHFKAIKLIEELSACIRLSSTSKLSNLNWNTVEVLNCIILISYWKAAFTELITTLLVWHHWGKIISEKPPEGYGIWWDLFNLFSRIIASNRPFYQRTAFTLFWTPGSVTAQPITSEQNFLLHHHYDDLVDTNLLILVCVFTYNLPKSVQWCLEALYNAEIHQPQAHFPLPQLRCLRF